jgi:ABC transporter substrate binding protein
MVAYTAEPVSSAPDLIVASSTPVIAALKQATRTIPIIFAVVNDPLGQGFIASLARPGGNITGFTFVDFPLIGKWLEMLKKIAPGVRRMTRLGTDVVGGIPWIESSAADALAHVRFCFDLAEKFGKDVSMLLDDVVDPNMRTLEMMATEAIRRGWQGRALAHQCRAMALYPQPVFHEMVDLLRRARVAIVSDPHTGPLHARGKELPPFPEVRSARLGPPPLADRQQSWCLQRPGARCLHV